MAWDSHWREAAAPIIAKIIEAHRREPLGAIRRHLRTAYPFGQRKNHPYKIWCSECRQQLLGVCLPPEFPASMLLSVDGRAVCADWWEDHNDPARSKFLREKHLNKHERQFGAYQRNRIDRLYGEALAAGGLGTKQETGA